MGRSSWDLSQIHIENSFDSNKLKVKNSNAGVFNHPIQLSNIVLNDKTKMDEQKEKKKGAMEERNYYHIKTDSNNSKSDQYQHYFSSDEEEEDEEEDEDDDQRYTTSQNDNSDRYALSNIQKDEEDISDSEES